MNVTMSMVFEDLSRVYVCEKGSFFNPDQRVDYARAVCGGQLSRREDGACFVVEGLARFSLVGVSSGCIVTKLAPGDLSASCAVEVISDASVSDIKDAINNIIVRYEVWAASLIDLGLHGAGLEELVDFAHDLFGNPVTIVDENYRLWAQTRADVMSDDLWISSGDVNRESLRYSQGMESDERGFVEYLFALKEEGLLTDYETSAGTKLAACAISSRSGSVMGVNVVEKNRSITQADIECLKYFADVVEAKFKAMEFSWLDSSGSYYALLQDVVRGNLLDNSEVKARLSRYWINLEKNYTVFVVAGRRGFLKYHQLCRIEDELADIFDQGQCVISARSLVVFLNHDRDLRDVLFDNLREYAQLNDLAIGVSESRSDDCSLRTLLEQAQFALRVRRRVSPEAHIFEYKCCREYYLVDVCSRQPDWKRYVCEGVLALYERNADSGSLLVDTLRCLVHNHGNRTIAAKELGIQRNALKYRIKKIEELCSVDLSDQDMFDHVAFSVSLMEYCADFDGYDY